MNGDPYNRPWPKARGRRDGTVVLTQLDGTQVELSRRDCVVAIGASTSGLNGVQDDELTLAEISNTISKDD